MLDRRMTPPEAWARAEWTWGRPIDIWSIGTTVSSRENSIVRRLFALTRSTGHDILLDGLFFAGKIPVH